MQLKDVGIKTGSLFIGKGATRGVEYLDETYYAAKPVLERAGTWINIAGGLAAIFGSFFGLRKYPTAQEIGVLVGGMMLTKTTDYVEELIPVGPGVRFVSRGRFLPRTAGATTGAIPPQGNIAVRAVATQGKYRMGT